MSWDYLQEQGEDFSLRGYLDGIQSVQLKLVDTKEKSYCKGKQMECLTDSRYGMMSAPSMASPGKGKSTSSQVDSHAKTSAKQEKEKALPENVADCGKNMQESLEMFGLNLCLLKTPQGYELKDLSPFSKTLPNWGMMQDGVCWGLATLVRHTKENECGLWLSTPTCVSMKGAKRSKKFLEGANRMPNMAEYAWENGGKPNMNHGEWIMGWPIGWTELLPLAMDKFREWQQQHLEF